MAAMQFIAFCVGAVLGFLAYLSFTPSVCVSKPAKYAVVIAIVLLLGVTLYLSIAAISVPYTHSLYVFARTFNHVAPRQLLIGLLFGLVLGLWFRRQIDPSRLIDTSHRIVHQSWGLLLLALFLTGLFLEPASRILSNITHISTPIAEVSLQSTLHDQLPHDQSQPLYLQGASATKHNATRAAVSTLQMLDERIKVDAGFIGLLDGHWKEEDRREFMDDNAHIVSLAKCFAKALHVHDGDEAIVDVKLREFRNTVAPSLRAALKSESYEKAAKYLKILMDGVSSYCSISNINNADFVWNGLNLPYLSLVVAHLYQSAGYSRDGAGVLALWIDKAKSFRTPNLHTAGDYRNKIEEIENILLIRAFIHLQRLLDVVGYSPSISATVERNVQLIEDVLRASRMPELRSYTSWDEDCPIMKENEEMYEFGRILVFALMAQRDELIRHRLKYFPFEWKKLSSIDDTGLLEYAEFNTEISTDCYPRTLGNYGKYYRGLFFANHGRLLMANDNRRQLQHLKIREYLGPIRRARALYVEALSFLKPFEDDEIVRYQDSRDTQGGQVGSIRKAMEYLSVREEAANIRMHLRKIEAILEID